MGTARDLHDCLPGVWLGPLATEKGRSKAVSPGRQDTAFVATRFTLRCAHVEREKRLLRFRISLQSGSRRSFGINVSPVCSGEEWVGDVGVGLLIVGRLAESELRSGARVGVGLRVVLHLEGVGGGVPCSGAGGERYADALSVVG